MRCPSHPIFGAVEEDLTTSKFSQHLPVCWSVPDLLVAPEFSPAPVKTGRIISVVVLELLATNWGPVSRLPMSSASWCKEVGSDLKVRVGVASRGILIGAIRTEGLLEIDNLETSMEGV